MINRGTVWPEQEVRGDCSFYVMVQEIFHKSTKPGRIGFSQKIPMRGSKDLASGSKSGRIKKLLGIDPSWDLTD